MTKKKGHTPGFCEPMTGTWADPEKVMCRDCALRDRTVVKMPGSEREIPVGVTRDFCGIYPDGKGKPSAILFHGADCEYYVKD